MDLPGGVRRTHWKQSVPIASWLNAVGVARFAVHHAGRVDGVAAADLGRFRRIATPAAGSLRATGAPGARVLQRARSAVRLREARERRRRPASAAAPSTRARSSTARRASPPAARPVVHEVAHQWFGDAVTEKDWDDVWLSEGFATYFTHLFTEHFSGRDAFVRGLEPTARRSHAEQTLAGPARHPPQPRRTCSSVLNRLVYQKGGWVLHMLRGTIGTEKFWTGIRDTIYRRYRNRNASTADFRQVMEQASRTVNLNVVLPPMALPRFGFAGR